MSEVTLEREAFAEWLRAKKPRAVVGERGVVWDCPIARYLKDQGAFGPRFVGEYYRLTLDGEPIGAPAWAGEFQIQVDESGEKWSGVTAATALRILESLE